MILVTGANGYIGSHLIDELLRHYPRQKITATDLKNNNINERVNIVNLDILANAQSDKLYDLVGCPEICIHLAWQDGFNHNAESHILNLPRHFLFLKNLVDHGCKRIAVAGSFREYGSAEGRVSETAKEEADNYYSWAKLSLKSLLEIYLKDKNVCLQWLRFFTPYGDDEKNDSILSKIIRWDREGKHSFPFTEGIEEYDYIHIDKLAEQIASVISQNKICGIINCCSGKPSSLKDKVEETIVKHKLHIRPKYGAFKSRPYDSKCIYGDNTKITEIMKNR